jgi:transcriptional regulator NrdR family protein
MHCPNCDHGKLNTVETYQTKERTIRYKKCAVCLWRFTSVEIIPDDHVVIPAKTRKGGK